MMKPVILREQPLVLSGQILQISCNRTPQDPMMEKKLMMLPMGQV